MDGILCYFPEGKNDKYYEVCNKWEKIVGNEELGKLEYTDFSFIYQESVNSYIAKKTSGGVKKKGRFPTEFELHKNKSKRVIPIALEKYFVEGINPEDYIPTHKNIFDFCVVKKKRNNFRFEEVNEGETIKVHKKLVRYYISTDGNVLMKRGVDEKGNPMNDHCEAPFASFPWMGQPKVTYFNQFKEPKNIDYSHYILKTLERIDKIEKTKKSLKYAEKFKTAQLSLW